MKKEYLKFILELIIHFIFWVGVYYFYTYFLGYGSKNTNYVNRFSRFLMPITLAISYFFLYFLIPQFLLKNKRKQFLLFSIYTFIVSFFFIIVSIFYGLVFSDALKEENYMPITKGFVFIILGVYFVVFIVVAIGLLLFNFKQSIKNEDLKSRFLQTQLQLKEQELKFLKMQIHPHFLFNTLNTLYGFALKKSDDTSDMILKLSNLLDYILYQVDKPLVLLNNEIKHIENYIALEKMRFQDSLQVYFDKDILNDSHKVAPMLLLPFVENAFKHGTQQDGMLNVNIKLKTTKNNLKFYIENTYKNKTISKKGIGLDNIKKRLEMLYQKNFDLNIISEGNKFKVQLEIPFKNE